MKKILALAASTSSHSRNKRLVAYAARLLEDEGDDIEVELLDLDDYEMPIYSADRQREGGIPDEAREFYARVGDADGLVISFAEHNGNYTAAYKNVFDWVSRLDRRVYQDKPTVMLSTSPGSRGGATVLALAVKSAPFFGNDLRAHLAVPHFDDNFDVESGVLVDPDLDGQLRAALATLPADGDAAAA